MVARRRHLPDLPALFRLFGRADRRHPRGNLPAGPSGAPRRRRRLAQPLLPKSAARRRIRRRGLQGHRPRLRHDGRRRRPHRTRAFARAAHNLRHRAQPHERPPHLVQAGPRGRTGLARARALLVPAGPQRLALGLRRRGVDASVRPGGRARVAVGKRRLLVPPPLRLLPARPQLVQSRGSGRISRHSQVLAEARRRRLSRRRRPRSRQGPRPSELGAHSRDGRGRKEAGEGRGRADVEPRRRARHLQAVAEGPRRIRP